MLKFRIEQVAICPRDPAAAKELLTAMGAGGWHDDHVVATGSVFGVAPLTNEADLAFEYNLLRGASELEVLNYTEGDDWMKRHGPSASHIGMHCEEEELDQWKEFFKARSITIAQEVWTKSHTNPVIADSRRYHYCIFDTRDILGIDVKFIVRRDLPKQLELDLG